MVRVVDHDGHTRAYEEAESAQVGDGALHLYHDGREGREVVASYAPGKWERWWVGEEKLESGGGPFVA